MPPEREGEGASSEPRTRKFCPQHGERDQHGIYCNAPMGTRLSCGKPLRVVEQQSSTEGEIPPELYATKAAHDLGHPLLPTRGFDERCPWCREKATREMEPDLSPESPEHQPDDATCAECGEPWPCSMAKRDPFRHNPPAPEYDPRTVAAVVEELREYGATVPAITVEVDDPLAVRTGSTTMPRSAADFIESHPRFKDGTGGAGRVTPEHYALLRAEIAKLGYADEIAWAQTVKPPADAISLFFEYGWVVVNSGMKNQVAARIWDRILAALSGGGKVADAFGHPGKATAIQAAWDDMDKRFSIYRDAAESGTVVEWCAAQPWIGPITKWHLAKNLGADCAKPDRWLERVALAAGETVDALCARLAAASGDRIATVDLVIWRACNLGLWSAPVSGKAEGGTER